ncbi:MAG: hypothetical protein EPO28_18435 [Saprospiraceae bacterium]|nr:MAG: hypothetical protein EPO28_18435 [Saprospiraceae bacterium]
MNQKLLPHLIAYFILMAISFIRFAPTVFQGKSLQQSDNIQATGMQMEMRKIHEKTGEYPLWTNSMFAGMPAYQIMYPTSNALQYVSRGFLLGNHMAPPHTGILLVMAGFYLLLIVLGVDWRIAIAGASCFGLAANHLSLAEAGHSTKIIASAYMAPILAAIILTFRGKYWIGGALTALFTGLQLYANHVQITYYFFLTLLVFGAVYLLEASRNGTIKNFITAAAISIAAVLLAVATNAGRLMTTQEYAAETIRGQSELTNKSGSSGSTAIEGGGLSKDYAFQWSYGKLETFNLLVPNFMGGSSSEGFASDANSATIAALRQMQNAEQATSLAQRTDHYWGSQPFTGGPVYMGAVLIFLFFLGAFLVKKPLKWYLLASVVLTLMLSWGGNFKALNYFIFDHLPLYNKFRDATTVLAVTNMLVALLAILGLQAFFEKSTPVIEKRKALLTAGGIAGGLVVMALLLSFGLDFHKEGEDFPAAVATALAEDRAGLLRADALRSLVFVAGGFLVLWYFLKKNFKPLWAALAIGALALIDIWGIGLRFINSEKYINSTDKNRITAPTSADEQILKDPDTYYRVADFRRNPFSNAITSYHHLSMGGYHAAKLMRYQELIERYLGDPSKYSHIYGMLNTKYFIGQKDEVIPNAEAAGNAWFVPSYDVVENGDAEIAALESLHPKEKAVIQKAFLNGLEGWQPQFDSSATIRLTHYHPDTMVYSYSAATDQLALFSEVYYPPSKGWNLYIDGKKAPDFTKADFILRAAKLPAGQHEVKMIFAPQTYFNGEKISLVASLLVIALTIWGVYWFATNYAFPNAMNLPSAEIKKTKPAATMTKRRKR